jgi:hypothetical protein
MSEQTSLFPNLKEDNSYEPVTEEQAKQKTAELLQVLMDQGFVNVKEEDISKKHLEDLIQNLKK